MKKQKEPKPKEFIMMNEDGEFYAGMVYGQLYWSIDRRDAKPFDDIAKYEGMKRWYPQKEIIYEFI